MKSDVVVPAEQQTGRGGAVCKLERSYDVRSGSKPEAKTYFNVLNLRKNIKKPRLRLPTRSAIRCLSAPAASSPGGATAHATPAVAPATPAMQATSTIAPASVPGSERQVIFCEAGGQRRDRPCHRLFRRDGKYHNRERQRKNRFHACPSKRVLDELGTKAKKLIFGNR